MIKWECLNKGGITMYIAKYALITLVAFAILTGCGMVNKQAEMSESTTMAADDGTALKAAEPASSAYQEVTLQVEGMT